MRPFIASHIPDHARVHQIGFDQISPSASSTRDLGTRLPSFQCEANKYHEDFVIIISLACFSGETRKMHAYNH